MVSEEPPQRLSVTKVTAHLWATQELLDEWKGLDLTGLHWALNEASKPPVQRPDVTNPQWAELIGKAEQRVDPLAEELLALHRPTPVWGATEVAYWECSGCDTGGGDSEPASWPCSTTEMIERHLNR